MDRQIVPVKDAPVKLREAGQITLLGRDEIHCLFSAKSERGN